MVDTDITLCDELSEKIIYDGSFCGLLTAVFDIYENKYHPQSILSDDEDTQLGLADMKIYIDSDESKSKRVINTVNGKLYSDCAYDIYMVYRSGIENRGMIIYNFIRAGLRIGPNIHENRAVREADEFYTLLKKVWWEIHKLYGFVRFAKKSGDIYYSKITPDHDIVEFLAKHFADRMRDSRWIIHDTSRNKAAICQYGKWIVSYMEISDIPPDDEDEQRWQSYWKSFYETIEIKSRHNAKLRRQWMPYRYWKNMTEMK